MTGRHTSVSVRQRRGAWQEPSELRETINAYLKNRSLDAAERRKFIEDEITFTDGTSGRADSRVYFESAELIDHKKAPLRTLFVEGIIRCLIRENKSNLHLDTIFRDLASIIHHDFLIFNPH